MIQVSRFTDLISNIIWLEWVNLAGAVTAVTIHVTCMAVFIARLANSPGLGRAVGRLQFILAIPLAILLALAPGFGRSWLYYLQASLMLAFLVVEFLLDYLLKVDFRGKPQAVIPYVMLFFAGSGGMIGIASLAGRGWTIAAGILFLAMAVLAFVQRAVKGM